MGKRINLADLADEPILDAPIPQLPADTPPPTTVPLGRVAPNPLNPRQDLGDLTELVASLQTMGQLQPCTVVTRAAYLAQYPEHDDTIGSAEFVVIAGGRRHAAATKAGLATLDINVKDILAASRETLTAAAVTENIERRNFDVLEEARAVQMLVTACGSGTAAAERLSRTKGWVSQRLALLKLAPDMQELLRSGELPVRDARRLAALAPDEQMQTWRTEQDAAAAARAEAERFTAVNQPKGEADSGGEASPAGGLPDAPEPSTVVATDSAAERFVAVNADDGGVTGEPRSPEPSSVATAVRRLGSTPQTIAQALRQHLDPDDLRLIAELLVVGL